MIDDYMRIYQYMYSICMYACMYVRIVRSMLCVHVYACMYLCMQVRMSVCMYRVVLTYAYKNISIYIYRHMYM